MSATAVAEETGTKKTIIVEVLDSTGHSEDAMSMEDAERLFNDKKGKGAAVFGEKDGQPTGALAAFSTEVDKMTVVPPISGG